MIEQIEVFLDASAKVAFTAHGGDLERYAHIGRMLKRFDYHRCSRHDRGVLLRYPCRYDQGSPTPQSLSQWAGSFGPTNRTSAAHPCPQSLCFLKITSPVGAWTTRISPPQGTVRVLAAIATASERSCTSISLPVATAQCGLRKVRLLSILNSPLLWCLIWRMETPPIVIVLNQQQPLPPNYCRTKQRLCLTECNCGKQKSPSQWTDLVQFQ